MLQDKSIEKIGCKLCQNIRSLKESHIIPETFYEGMYDKKHRILPISLENSKLEFEQKGIKEKLLCGDCEMKLSKWEKVLKKDIVDIENKQSKYLKISPINERWFKVENIRYKTFKLAVLSIIWRLSISTNSFYSKYRLGPYEEKIRQILLNENDIDEKKYPIMVTRYELDGVFIPGIMMGFPPSRYEIYTFQSFVIRGHKVSVFINDNKFPKKLPKEIFLRNSGELYIAVRDLTELASPNSVLAKIYDKQVNKMFEKMT